MITQPGFYACRPVCWEDMAKIGLARQLAYVNQYRVSGDYRVTSLTRLITRGLSTSESRKVLHPLPETVDQDTELALHGLVVVKTAAQRYTFGARLNREASEPHYFAERDLFNQRIKALRKQRNEHPVPPRDPIVTLGNTDNFDDAQAAIGRLQAFMPERIMLSALKIEPPDLLTPGQPMSAFYDSLRRSK